MSVDILRGKDLVQVEAGNASSMVLSSKGKLWGFGSNRSLNLGLRKEITQLNAPQLIKSFRDMDITQVCCAKSGHGHCLGLTQAGQVYIFGTSHCGALGLGSEVKQTLPVLLPLSEKIPIKQVATGVKHCLLLTETGIVYSFGENAVGQLGVGRKKENDWRWVNPTINTPQQLALYDVEWVCAGETHNVAKSEQDLWLWGGNSSGQLGLTCNEDQFLPVMSNIQTASSAACGSNHTLVVSSGRLWSFGSNSHRQLGLEGDIKSVNTPTLVPVLKDPLIVSACADHSFCIDKNYMLWGFGCNDEGQLGWNPELRKVIEKPEIVNDFRRIRVYQVSTSATHSVVLGATRH